MPGPLNDVSVNEILGRFYRREGAKLKETKKPLVIPATPTNDKHLMCGGCGELFLPTSPTQRACPTEACAKAALRAASAAKNHATAMANPYVDNEDIDI